MLLVRLHCHFGKPVTFFRALGKASATNYLLEMCIQRMQLNNAPTLIGGDINRLVQKLPAWKSLAGQGFTELHELWTRRRGFSLPATCTSSQGTGPGSRHDTILIDPRLHASLQDARVLLDFHRRRPLQLDFVFPRPQITSLRWKLPRSYADLQPDSTAVASRYNQLQAYTEDPDACDLG